MSMVEQQETEKGIRIFFNDKPLFAPKDTWTGAELREFFKVPLQYQLYKETPGKAHPDLLIKPEETIVIKPGDKFYDLPPGTVGGINFAS